MSRALGRLSNEQGGFFRVLYLMSNGTHLNLLNGGTFTICFNILKLKAIHKWPFFPHELKVDLNATLHCIAMSTGT